MKIKKHGPINEPLSEPSVGRSLTAKQTDRKAAASATWGPTAGTRLPDIAGEATVARGPTDSVGGATDNGRKVATTVFQGWSLTKYKQNPRP